LPVTAVPGFRLNWLIYSYTKFLPLTLITGLFTYKLSLSNRVFTYPNYRIARRTGPNDNYHYINYSLLTLYNPSTLCLLEM